MERRNSLRRILERVRSEEEAFSMIEAMVAVTILMIAIMMSMQPMMAAMIRVADARTLTISENLAQAELESIRSLRYQDVGSPGYTPSGVLPRSRVVNIEDRDYQVDIEVTYQGSISGLEIVAQGGDGVQGTWDPGVDYKIAKVTVTASDSSSPQVVMETLVAPGNIGAHEGIANIRVTLAKYEPFEPSDIGYPALAIQSSPSLPIRSGTRLEQQVFAAIDEGAYVVSMDIADGWVVHPADTAAGLLNVTATAGLLTETTFRVYRPARLIATITNADTGDPVSEARIRLVHTSSGVQTDYAPGEHTISGLIPDAYDITVSAAEYFAYSATSVNIPGDYPDPDHLLNVALVPIPPPTTTSTSTTTTTTSTTVVGATTTTTLPTATTTTSTTSTTTTTTTPPANLVTVTFTVRDNTDREVNGATVTVDHPTRGVLTAVTDHHGRAYLDLEAATTFTATATTPWGHGPDSETFNTGNDVTISLRLQRPLGMGTYVLKGGDHAQFLVSQGTGWMILPPNHDDEASFVRPGGWVLVAKQCDANGSIKGTTWVYVRSGRNLASTIYGYCP
ncbi:MAG: hypothetical protein MUP76_10795 [Acidimicrobiia bacterium]|nr:hypothetical protein [Acidimicrobiia bacterium]